MCWHAVNTAWKTICSFSKYSKKIVFSKNTWKLDDFCIFGKDGISFPYKYDIILLSKKPR